MSKRSVAQLISLTDQIIKANDNEEITAIKDNSLRKTFIDSFLNLVDGGLVIDAEIGYSTPITPSSDYAFATRKYVDDATGTTPDLTAYMRLDGTSVDTTGSLKIGDGYGLKWSDNVEIRANGAPLSGFMVLVAGSATGDKTSSYELTEATNDAYHQDLSVSPKESRISIDANNGVGIKTNITFNNYFGYLRTDNLTATRTYQFPNTSGTIALTSDIPSVAGFITLSDLSAPSPLAYDSGTGAFSIQLATGAQNGYLSSTDWNTFNGKQSAFTAQAANLVYAGPSSGGSATPTFRALSLTDMPAFTAYAALPGIVDFTDKAFTAIQKLDGNQQKRKAIGLRFSDTFNRASLGANYTQNGSTATFSVVSNQLVVGAGTGSLSEYIYYNQYATNTTKMAETFSYIVGTANTAGVYFGFTGASDIIVWLDQTVNSASVLKIYSGGILSAYALESGTGSVAVVPGDVITMKMVYIQNRLTVDVKVNGVTGIAASLKYQSLGGTDAAPVVRNVKIGSVGGTHYVTSISAYDLNYLFSELTLGGDSISWGKGPTTLQDSWVYKFMYAYPYINNFSGPGMTAQNLNNSLVLSEIIASRTTRFLLFLGTNDFAGGRSNAQVMADVANIVSTLQAAGIIVDIATAIPRSAIQAALDTYNASLRSTYSATNKIIDFASIVSSLNDLSDTIHPGNRISTVMSDYVISEYADILSAPSQMLSNEEVSNPVYFNKGNTKAATTLSAVITNTDTAIPVTSMGDFPNTGWVMLTNGVNSEIIRYYGVSGGFLRNCLRGQFTTTALTIAASPTTYTISVINRMEYNDTNNNPASLYYNLTNTTQNYYGFNTTGPMVAGTAFDFQFRSSGNQFMMLRNSVSGGGVGLWLSKAGSTDNSNIFFGEATTARFRIQHTATNTLLIGRSNGNELVINGANVGINTTTQTYRLTNGGADVTPKFIADVDGSITAGSAFAFDATNGLVFTQANGTRRIGSAYMKLINTTTTAGSEAADLGFYTQTAGATPALRASIGAGGVTTTGFATGYTAKTATYTIVQADYTVDCTTGTFSVTLPTAVGFAGKVYKVKNSGTGVITIGTTSSQTIDGFTTKVLNTQYSGFELQSNGTNWIIIGAF